MSKITLLLSYLDGSRFLFDLGLLVLIWMVQLIVYPSFKYYADKKLLAWHETYTKRIAILVIPLIFGQLITGILQLYEAINWYTATSIILIVGVWVSTFAQFVPMHSKISKGAATPVLLNRLVGLNWIRTVLWSWLFVLSCFKLFY